MRVEKDESGKIGWKHHKIVKCHYRELRGCFGQGGSMKSEKVKVKLLSHVPLFATPWTVAHQAPLSMGFSRQEYWSGLPFPSPKVLKDNMIISITPLLMGMASQCIWPILIFVPL